MTLDELILYYGGIGYRKSRIHKHRGTHKNGYIDAKFYLNEYLKGNKYYIQGFSAVDNSDIGATDWVGRETDNKFLNLMRY